MTLREKLDARRARAKDRFSVAQLAVMRRTADRRSRLKRFLPEIREIRIRKWTPSRLHPRSKRRITREVHT